MSNVGATEVKETLSEWLLIAYGEYCKRSKQPRKLNARQGQMHISIGTGENVGIVTRFYTGYIYRDI